MLAGVICFPSFPDFLTRRPRANMTELSLDLAACAQRGVNFRKILAILLNVYQASDRPETDIRNIFHLRICVAFASLPLCEVSQFRNIRAVVIVARLIRSYSANWSYNKLWNCAILSYYYSKRAEDYDA